MLKQPTRLRMSGSAASDDASLPSDITVNEVDRVTVRSTGVSVLSPARFPHLSDLLLALVV